MGLLDFRRKGVGGEGRGRWTFGFPWRAKNQVQGSNGYVPIAREDGNERGGDGCRDEDDSAAEVPVKERWNIPM